MPYAKRKAAIVTDDERKRVVGYKEKTGEVHKTKKGFYKSKAGEKKSDKKAFRTADGKVHATMAAYTVHKAKLKADPNSPYYK